MNWIWMNLKKQTYYDKSRPKESNMKTLLNCIFYQWRNTSWHIRFQSAHQREMSPTTKNILTSYFFILSWACFPLFFLSATPCLSLSVCKCLSPLFPVSHSCQSHASHQPISLYSIPCSFPLSAPSAYIVYQSVFPCCLPDRPCWFPAMFLKSPMYLIYSHLSITCFAWLPGSIHKPV